MPQPLPAFCLSFDLEEFDLPLEHGKDISSLQQVDISAQGMDFLLPLLDKYRARCTFFTTANFAQHKPELIRQIAQKHEIASHSFYHSSFDTADLLKSRQVLEQLSGQKIYGFRMPRMAGVNYKDLQEAGYAYDSSLNPTLIPGRYNHLSSPKTIFKKDNLLIFPATVTPRTRRPLFWLSLKNSRFDWYSRKVQQCLKHYGYVNIYLHPWEFADIQKFKLPRYLVKTEKGMQGKLEKLLAHFSGKVRFTSLEEVLRERHAL